MARLRAPRDPDPESIIENLVSMVRTKVTWAKFIDICREKKVGAGCEKAGFRGIQVTKTQFAACVCTKIRHFSWKKMAKNARFLVKKRVFRPQISS